MPSLPFNRSNSCSLTCSPDTGHNKPTHLTPAISVDGFHGTGLGGGKTKGGGETHHILVHPLESQELQFGSLLPCLPNSLHHKRFKLLLCRLFMPTARTVRGCIAHGSQARLASQERDRCKDLDGLDHNMRSRTKRTKRLRSSSRSCVAVAASLEGTVRPPFIVFWQSSSSMSYSWNSVSIFSAFLWPTLQ